MEKRITYKAGERKCFAIVYGSIIVGSHITIVVGKVVKTVQLSVGCNKT